MSDGTRSLPHPEAGDSDRQGSVVVEFSTVCDTARVSDRWAVTVSGEEWDALEDTDARVDFLKERLDGGSVEHLHDDVSWEEDRELEPRSIVASPWNPAEGAVRYTVVGYYTDTGQSYVTTVVSDEGPEVAHRLGREQCSEDNRIPVEDLNLVVVAVFTGTPELAQLDYESLAER